MGIDNITSGAGAPAGSATAAKQDTGNTSLASIDTKVPADPAREGGNLATIAGKDFATQTTLALIKAKTDNLDVLLSTRTKPADTQPVSIASMPSTPVTGTFWQVTQPVSGTFWQATQPVSGTFWQATQPVSIASMPSTPVTGTFWQATQPVSLTTLPALTAGSAVIGHVIADSGSTTAVTGNVTVVQATGTNLHTVLDATSTTAVTQATGTNLHTVVDSGTLTAVTAITNALPAGSNVIGHVIADTGSTTAVTGNVTVVQPTGTNLHAVLDSGTTTVTQATGSNLHTVVDSGTLTAVTAITNALPAGSNVIGHVIADTGSTTAVTGNVTVIQATGTNLHAVIDSAPTTAVTGTFFQATQPVSAVTLPLPTGAAQDSSLTTLNTSVSTLDSDLAIAQGAVLTTQKGPMMQAVVSDAPQSYIDNYIQPLSVTREGRLRVSAVAGDVTEIWNSTFNDPFLDMSNLWEDVGWGTASF